MDFSIIGPVLILIVLAIGIIIIRREIRVSREEKPADGSLQLLQSQLHEINRTLDSKLSESSRSMDSRIGESMKLVRDVTERLTKLDETNRQVVSFADQLRSLQDILKNPKQRGILGEYYLETLLKNVLPPGSYQMQYPFPDGTIVDAAVFVKDKIIPVDSKFSLENYNRLAEEQNPAERDRLEKIFVNDLKNRITETAKYIQPEKGTTDFAFMFIPHEAIYYDLLVNKIGALKEEDTESLIQRAAGKYKVIIVSPTSFLAYLQTVLQGLKAMQIEETAKDIVKRVDELGKHLKSFEEYHQKLGNTLGTAVNHYNSAGKEFKKIDKDVMRITGTGFGTNPEVLNAPDDGG
jgi:DNA recombination protein RmuC